MYQAYKSITLNDSWPNTFCQSCREPIDLDPWKDVKIGWSEALNIALDLFGKPTGFFNQDFLIVFQFGEVKLVFCSQGPRRGEIQVNVPVGDDQADKLIKAFLDRVREVVEGGNNREAIDTDDIYY